MKQLEPAHVLDGYVIEACIHSSSLAHIYTVHCDANQPDPGFPLVMKVPHATAGDGGGGSDGRNIVGFEVEAQIMQALNGSHVPRFVAAGDMARTPYLVMEYIPGQTLEHWLEHKPLPGAPDIARLGVAMAHAAHALHRQNVVHLGLQPANVLFREDASAVLLGYSLACHAHYPDLLAAQQRTAVGSPAWISPEQVLGMRGDPRSDIFAIGVMLYQLCTGKLPFGQPLTPSGLRQRLWMEPAPPRKVRFDLPEWLQEVVLRCLEPDAAHRYPSAAHLAFDLTHPEQVHITARGQKTEGASFLTHLGRWLKATGMHYQPSPMAAQQVEAVPIVMVAIPHKDVTEATLYSLRVAVQRTLGTQPGAQLACVTVVSPNTITATEHTASATTVQRQHLTSMRQWAQPLDHPGHQTSFHVLPANDVAQALLDYAAVNNVTVMVLGAATHGLKTQHFVATVPTKVAMDAPCTVILVKQTWPH